MWAKSVWSKSKARANLALKTFVQAKTAAYFEVGRRAYRQLDYFAFGLDAGGAEALSLPRAARQTAIDALSEAQVAPLQGERRGDAP